MENLQYKKTIFYANEIVFQKKKGNIIINVTDIKHISYIKPTLLNYLLFYNQGFLGHLKIYLNKEIRKKRKYHAKIKYKDVIKLREFFQKEIDVMK